MIDLDELNIPPFEVSVDGKIHTFDAYSLGWSLRSVAGVESPIVARDEVNKVTGLSLDSFRAIAFLRALDQFLVLHEQTLKKVLDQSPRSVSATESPQEKSSS